MQLVKTILYCACVIFVSCNNKKTVSIEPFEELHHKIIACMNTSNLDSFMTQTRSLMQHFSYDTIFASAIWSNDSISNKPIREVHFCNDIIKDDRLENKQEDDMKRNANILYDIYPEMFCFRRKMLISIKKTNQYQCKSLNYKTKIILKERVLLNLYRNDYRKMWLINIRTEVRKDIFIDTEFMVFKKEKDVIYSGCLAD
jgi:hypothetical protein